MKFIFAIIVPLLTLPTLIWSQGKITGTGYGLELGDSLIQAEYQLEFTVNKDFSGSFKIVGIPELINDPVKFEKFSFENNEIYTSNYERWGYTDINLFNFSGASFKDAEAAIFHFAFIPLDNYYEIKIMDGVRQLYRFEIHVLNFNEWHGPIFFRRDFDFGKIDTYSLQQDEYVQDSSYTLGYHVVLTDTSFSLTNNLDQSNPAYMKIYSIYRAENNFELFFIDNNDRIMIPNRTPTPEIALSIMYDKQRKVYQQIHLINN